MYSTVNVATPVGTAAAAASPTVMLGLLAVAATLTLIGILCLNTPPARVVPRGPSLPRAKRLINGPRDRRY
jgi:hypothetical protein